MKSRLFLFSILLVCDSITGQFSNPLAAFHLHHPHVNQEQNVSARTIHQMGVLSLPGIKIHYKIYGGFGASAESMLIEALNKINNNVDVQGLTKTSTQTDLHIIPYKNGCRGFFEHTREIYYLYLEESRCINSVEDVMNQFNEIIESLQPGNETKQGKRTTEDMDGTVHVENSLISDTKNNEQLQTKSIDQANIENINRIYSDSEQFNSDENDLVLSQAELVSPVISGFRQPRYIFQLPSSNDSIVKHLLKNNKSEPESSYVKDYEGEMSRYTITEQTVSCNVTKPDGMSLVMETSDNRTILNGKSDEIASKVNASNNTTDDEPNIFSDEKYNGRNDSGLIAKMMSNSTEEMFKAKNNLDLQYYIFESDSGKNSTEKEKSVPEIYPARIGLEHKNIIKNNGSEENIYKDKNDKDETNYNDVLVEVKLLDHDSIRRNNSGRDINHMKYHEYKFVSDENSLVNENLNYELDAAEEKGQFDISKNESDPRLAVIGMSTSSDAIVAAIDSSQVHYYLYETVPQDNSTTEEGRNAGLYPVDIKFVKENSTKRNGFGKNIGKAMNYDYETEPMKNIYITGESDPKFTSGREITNQNSYDGTDIIRMVIDSANAPSENQLKEDAYEIIEDINNDMENINKLSKSYHKSITSDSIPYNLKLSEDSGANSEGQENTEYNTYTRKNLDYLHSHGMKYLKSRYLGNAVSKNENFLRPTDFDHDLSPKEKLNADESSVALKLLDDNSDRRHHLAKDAQNMAYYEHKLDAGKKSHVEEINNHNNDSEMAVIAMSNSTDEIIAAKNNLQIQYYRYENDPAPNSAEEKERDTNLYPVAMNFVNKNYGKGDSSGTNIPMATRHGYDVNAGEKIVKKTNNNNIDSERAVIKMSNSTDEIIAAKNNPQVKYYLYETNSEQNSATEDERNTGLYPVEIKFGNSDPTEDIGNTEKPDEHVTYPEYYSDPIFLSPLPEAPNNGGQSGLKNGAHGMKYYVETQQNTNDIDKLSDSYHESTESSTSTPHIRKRPSPSQVAHYFQSALNTSDSHNNPVSIVETMGPKYFNMPSNSPHVSNFHSDQNALIKENSNNKFDVAEEKGQFHIGEHERFLQSAVAHSEHQSLPPSNRMGTQYPRYIGLPSRSSQRTHSYMTSGYWSKTMKNY